MAIRKPCRITLPAIWNAAVAQPDPPPPHVSFLGVVWISGVAGDIAAFGSDLGVRQSVSLETRLDWCLGDAQEWIEQAQKEEADEEGGEGGVTKGEEDSHRAGFKQASAPCPVLGWPFSSEIGSLGGGALWWG